MPPPPSLPPVLSSLTPNVGPAGGSVYISGIRLADSTGPDAVTFGGVPAIVTYGSYNTLIVIAPPHVPGAVSVVAFNDAGGSNALTFTYNALGSPNIASVNPNAGPTGTPVTVVGTNFGDSQNSSTVKFNGVTASVVSWSATSIQVIVPPTATTGPVIVTVGGVASNSVTFTVTTPSNGGMLSALNIFAIPSVQFLTPQIFTLDPTNFDDQANGSNYSWKVEDVIAGRTPTINRVIVSYRDLGLATATFTLTGNDDSGNIISNSATIQIGTVAASKKIITVVLGITLTAQNLQLSVLRPAAGGPVSITKIRMEGKVEMTTY